MSSPLKLLIFDACVLIDFCDVDRSILGLASKHVGQVHIATPVFDEVDQLDDSSAESLGLRLVEPSLEILVAAAALRGALSFQDRVCVLLARAHGWTCVSNDGRLRRACADEGIEVLWGLELLALLVEAGALPGASAKNLAEEIRKNNSFITAQVLERFLKRIGA